MELSARTCSTTDAASASRSQSMATTQCVTLGEAGGGWGVGRKDHKEREIVVGGPKAFSHNFCGLGAAAKRALDCSKACC
jgi:hypothetical protein